MSFKDRSWSSRFEQMGDEAEAVFEAVADRSFVRYGLNRPPVQMHKLPARIRYTPDYLMSAKLVEVQGFGRDQMCKLKIDKWMSLHHWNSIFPVELFVWDSTNSRWCFVTLKALDDLLGDGSAVCSKFPEGHVYMGFPGDAIFEIAHKQGTWTDEQAEAA